MKNFTTAEGGSVTWKENENFDNEELYREYQIIFSTWSKQKMH